MTHHFSLEGGHLSTARAAPLPSALGSGGMYLGRGSAGSLSDGFGSGRRFSLGVLGMPRAEACVNERCVFEKETSQLIKVGADDGLKVNLFL